jgi:hypothetical protein
MRLLLLVLPLISGALGTTSCQAGYCCDGSIVMKKHNNSFSADNFYCCKGDPNSAIMGDSGPTTCTAGTQIPLTQASAEAGSKTTAAAGAGSSSTSSGGAGAALVTNGPLIGAAVAAGHLLFAV